MTDSPVPVEQPDDWQHPPICNGCGKVHAVFVRCADGRFLCPICCPPDVENCCDR